MCLPGVVVTSRSLTQQVPGSTNHLTKEFSLISVNSEKTFRKNSNLTVESQSLLDNQGIVIQIDKDNIYAC